MKILSLVWNQVLPARFGGQKATALFNRHLAEQAELVCLCSRENEADGALPYRLRAELPPGKSGIFRPRVWKQIAAVLREERPTHLLLEYPYHALAAWRACRAAGVKLVLREHNIEYRRFRRMGHPAWWLLRWYERWACRRADLLLFLTAEDQRTAIDRFRVDPSDTVLVPYGAEPADATGSTVDIREHYRIPPSAKVLLFAGTLDYAPNADAVQALYREVAPRLDAAGITYRILLCGRNRHPKFQHLNALAHPCILQAGEVPDIAPYYAAADLFLNPVLSGGGVQTKVVDALARQCPVLSFAFGAQGIDPGLCGPALRTVVDGDWEGFVRALLEPLPADAAVPEAFFQHYAWSNIASRVISRLKNEPA